MTGSKTLPEMALLGRLVVAQMAGVANPNVSNLHVLVDLIAKVRHIGALLAPDLRQVLLVGVDLVPIQGPSIQGPKPTGVTNERLLLLCV